MADLVLQKGPKLMRIRVKRNLIICRSGVVPTSILTKCPRPTSCRSGDPRINNSQGGLAVPSGLRCIGYDRQERAHPRQGHSMNFKQRRRVKNPLDPRHQESRKFFEPDMTGPHELSISGNECQGQPGKRVLIHSGESDLQVG